jgi:hypothetical protein
MNFIADWPSYFVLELTDSVIYKAGELAEHYKLKGFDFIHMASVLTPAGVLAEEGSKEPLIIGCWDKGLAEPSLKISFKLFFGNCREKIFRPDFNSLRFFNKREYISFCFTVINHLKLAEKKFNDLCVFNSFPFFHMP